MTPSDKKSNRILVASGFSIIEIVLAISLFAIISLGAISSAVYGENAQLGSGERKRATLVADQTAEIIRAIRDSSSEGFSALADGVYGLAKDWNGAWTLLPDEPDTTDTFLRTIAIDSIDAHTKDITTTICWPATDCAGSVSITTYLTDWRTDTTATPGGIRVAVSGTGYAYMITTNNTLQVYDVSTPASPVRVSTLTLAGIAGTTPTSIFYTTGRVYITSNDSNAELQIVDVSTPANPEALGTLDLTVNGDDAATADGVWANASGDVFVIARDSAGARSKFFMIDAADATTASSIENGAVYTTSETQTPGAITVGSISSTPTMCTTEGGAVDDTGYVLHCYTFNFGTAPYDIDPPSYTQTVSDADSGELPSRTVSILDGTYITTPGGKISSNNSTPVTISSNAIYDLSTIIRSGRTYAYAAVIGDVNTGLKEIDITDPDVPIVITAQDTDGTFSGVVYDNSTTPDYIFGANRTGSTLGFVAFAPTPVGIAVTPIDNITATTVEGASSVHCDPIVDPLTDSGCPITYSLTNVTGDPIDYTISDDDTWVNISDTGGTLGGSDNALVIVSVDAATVLSKSISEGTYPSTLHITYEDADGNPADITRTITLTVLPATGIKVKAR